MESDRRRWDGNYADADRPDAQMPDALEGDDELQTHVPSDGLALDVACGRGAQSLWLAQRGLRVIALDASEVGIGLVREAAQAAELGSRIDARVTDLDHGLPGDIGPVDLVVCQRFRDPMLYDPFVRVLRPGGIGIVTVLSAVGLDGDPGPFHAPPDDLHDAFDRSDVELLRDVESAGVASVVFRRL